MSEKKFIIGIVAGTIVLLSVSYFFLSKDAGTSPVKVASYQSSDKEKPQVEAKQMSANLGSMKVSEQKSYDFVIKNTGEKPLLLSNVSSSCGCTVGQVIYEGKESEEFSMHPQGSFMLEVAAQKQAILRVTYRPYVMPVYGPVEREVYVETNDPQNPKLIFKITAFVK